MADCQCESFERLGKNPTKEGTLYPRFLAVLGGAALNFFKELAGLTELHPRDVPPPSESRVKSAPLLPRGG